MAVVASDLPSTVEDSLAECPQFRILVVGKSGVGKSSLISDVFNIKGVDIAHNRAGKADVEHEYTSDANSRFVLHDSQGFEAGTTGNWCAVERFLRSRNGTMSYTKRVHAIWLCIETPRPGAREIQTGDEKLLSISKELNVPTVVVFTKFDLLVNHHFREIQETGLSEAEKLKKAQKLANEDFRERIENSWAQKGVSCVQVSTTTDDAPSVKEMLQNLTEHTKDGLQGLLDETLVSWASAQQINPHQKVEESIRVVKEQYWVNLGQSTAFKDHRLSKCLFRIGEDILSVWNLHDPHKLLTQHGLLKKIIKLINEFAGELKEGVARYDLDGKSGNSKSGMSSRSGILGSVLAWVSKFLESTGYRPIPEAAQYLGAYIVDLILVLYRIFVATLRIAEPPRAVSSSIVDEELRKYKDSMASRVHSRIREIGVTRSSFEQGILDLIRGSLKEH